MEVLHMSHDHSKVGQKIKLLRIERAWTQAHLAAVARISERTVNRLEKGHCYSFESLLAIASALDVDVRDLTGETAPSPHDKQEAQATYGPGNELQPTVLTPTDIRVLRQARSFQFYWDEGYDGYTWLQCYGVPRDIGLPDVGYSLWARSSVSDRSMERGYPTEALARITSRSNPDEMLRWRSVVENCQPEDILYLMWHCDDETTPEQLQEDLAVDTLDLAILRDDKELSQARVITRSVPQDSPQRLFRLKRPKEWINGWLGLH
jgi:transcriptional regulator with XRE-family HTH domain